MIFYLAKNCCKIKCMSINQELSKILLEMAELLTMKEVLFKPRAYENASQSIASLNENVKDIYTRSGIKALMEIPSVGRGIAEKIEEYIKTGHIKEYQEMKKDMPVDIAGLTAIEGVGPKMIGALYKQLGVKNINDLEKAARAGKINGLERFGKKSEEKILKGIEFLRASGGRMTIGEAVWLAREIEEKISKFHGVNVAIAAGSIRRRKETIGDLDFLAISNEPEKVRAQFVKLPNVSHVYASGFTKTMVRLKEGLDADLRVIPAKSFGAALNYFTGSKEHNVALREIAIKNGMKLNEYGLFRLHGKKEIQIAGESEEGIYKALGLHYIQPEMREMKGEIEAAALRPAQGKPYGLPTLIGYGDLLGDLQTQTNWTDGANSIEEMARAAVNCGLQYIVITDHTKALAMTGGADEKKLLRQMAEIKKVNKKIRGAYPHFKILTGAEVNIGKDGSLDIKDEVLEKLEVVGAAVHSHFNLSKAEQTKRIIRAMENKNVDIIFHLTTRLINKRKPIELDIDEIIKTAKRTGTILEIDAHPERLDIKDDYIRKCIAAGVKMSIDSDAHSVEHFPLLEYGIAEARRGWATKNDIVNSWPVEKMLKFLKKP